MTETGIIAGTGWEDAKRVKVCLLNLIRQWQAEMRYE